MLHLCGPAVRRYVVHYVPQAIYAATDAIELPTARDSCYGTVRVALVAASERNGEIDLQMKTVSVDVG